MTRMLKHEAPKESATSKTENRAPTIKTKLPKPPDKEQSQKRHQQYEQRNQQLAEQQAKLQQLLPRTLEQTKTIRTEEYLRYATPLMHFGKQQPHVKPHAKKQLKNISLFAQLAQIYTNKRSPEIFQELVTKNEAATQKNISQNFSEPGRSETNQAESLNQKNANQTKPDTSEGQQRLQNMVSEYQTQLLKLRQAQRGKTNNQTRIDREPVMRHVRDSSLGLGKAFLQMRLVGLAKIDDLAAAIESIQDPIDKQRLLRGVLTPMRQNDRDAEHLQQLFNNETEHSSNNQNSDVRQQSLALFSNTEKQQQQETEEKQSQTKDLQLAAQRTAASEFHSATPEVMQRIEQQLGGGQTLPEHVQRMLETGLNKAPGFFAAMRIHTSNEANNISKIIHAHAFTVGKDVFFAAAKYQPNDATEFALLMHEATHVAQNLEGRVTGKGIDPDKNLETEAAAAEEKAKTSFTQIEKQATTNAPIQPLRATHSTGRALQRRHFVAQRKGSEDQAPKEIRAINSIGHVFNDDGVNVYVKPNTSGKDKAIARLKFGDRALVVREVEGGWYQISMLGGQIAYANKNFFRVYSQDPGAKLHKVQAGESAIGIAEKYYGNLVKGGQDLRYFVNAIAYCNPKALKKPDSGNWKNVAFNATTTIYIPGIQIAIDLKNKIDDGSLTNGFYANIKSAMGRMEDLVSNVTNSPQYIPEVLGDLWEVIKEKKTEIIAMTLAFVAAEFAVGVLGALPTGITQILAMLLQGLITLFVGYGAIQSVVAAIAEGVNWIKLAWAANGNADKLKEASKAYLRMQMQLALTVLAVLGTRASAVKLKGLYTKYQGMGKLPLVPTKAMVSEEATVRLNGAKTTVRNARTKIKAKVATVKGKLQGKTARPQTAHGKVAEAAGKELQEAEAAFAKLPDAQRKALLRLAGNDEKLIGRLLTKITDPLELKAMLLKTGSGKTLENLLGKYKLEVVKDALKHVDARSINPKFVEELVDLMVEFPVPGRKFTAQELLDMQKNLKGIRGQIKPLQAEYDQVNKELASLRAQPKSAEIQGKIDALEIQLKNTDSRLRPLRNQESEIADAVYQERRYTPKKELTLAESARQDLAQVRFDDLLRKILDDANSLQDGKYVVRITTKETMSKYYSNRETGTFEISREAYMTNKLPTNNVDASHAAQIKPAWYWETEGMPEVAILIPRKNLSTFKTPLASGGKAGSFELTTSAYPEAGQGGFLQFSGKTNRMPLSEVIVIDLKTGGRIR